METPEKIYIFENPISGTPDDRWLLKRSDENDIEYTRTDVIVEKACDLLVNCIEDFMLRRMEIWDEECKKQTLENIRKALKESQYIDKDLKVWNIIY